MLVGSPVQHAASVEHLIEIGHLLCNHSESDYSSQFFFYLVPSADLLCSATFNDPYKCHVPPAV